MPSDKPRVLVCHAFSDTLITRTLVSTDLINALSHEARNAPLSGIIEIVNAGRLRKDLIPLWAGEADLPTPDFICEAAIKSLKEGETFYTWQRGIPELRQAISDYYSRTYNVPVGVDRICVTGSGMQAIQLAVAAVTSAGDEVIVPTPAWPNMAAAVELRGAKAVTVPMSFDAAGWQLDKARLEAAITPRTRAIFLNSPCNPTGWVASEEFLMDVLQIARERGVWIIADEIYGQFHYGNAKTAPSFLTISTPDDPVIYVNTMSKNWAMTGWRLGWIAAPAQLGQVLENLVQYSTSGVPAFNQRAAVAALENGQDFLEEQIAKAAKGREILLNGFASVDRIQAAAPAGAFYYFFSVDGVTDTRRFALDLLEQTGVGLAPGTAFGEAGSNFVRLCFARRHDHLEMAVDRIREFLKRG